jgi:hypothetical protein
MALEANAMRACGRAGLRVPEVIVDDDGTLLGTAGLVMSRVPGETLARRILRDDEFAKARAALTPQLGQFLAGLHAVPVAEVPGIAPADTLTAYWTRYEQMDDASGPTSGCGRTRRNRPSRSSCTATCAWATSSSTGTASPPPSTGSSCTSATRSRTSGGCA